MLKLSNIQTEKINEKTKHIDSMSTIEMLKLINDEDKKVAIAVNEVLPQIEKAVDVVYTTLKNGGRLIYCGCGTSGRLGVLDAVECTPTFGTSPEMVQAIMAGGEKAFVRAVEGAEDSKELGEANLKAINFSSNDVLVGIAASGRTPYVIGAMEYAKSLKVPVIAVTCCPNSVIDELSDIGIAPTPGPEVVTGSTRLKSGTAQKLVLNMISTASMIKLGKVYSNLMVDVKATNEKLVQRTISIVMNATDVDYETAKKTLERCEYWAKPAILMILCNIDAKKAISLLEQNGGKISDSVKSLDK